MKNPYIENLYRRMRQFHRHHQWHLEKGLYVPHMNPDPITKLSWWDDVGFILNGRRIKVFWVHPRMKYSDAIDELAWKEAGDSPLSGKDIFGPSEKQWTKVGRSRKKVTSYVTRQTPDTQRTYYDKLSSIKMRLEAEGIDLVVKPTISVEPLSWGRHVSICIPMEARDEKELKDIAVLVKRVLKGETTLAKEYPEYQYGREDWLSESSYK